MRRRILLMLAAASVVAACRKDATSAVQKIVTTADSADQVIWGMRMVLTDRGVQRAELAADTGYFFDENTRIELRVVKTNFFNQQGARDGVLTSKRGTYNTRANVMEARDDVVIVGVDGKKLTSPMVRFEQFRNLVVSDSPFVLVDGTRQLEGIGFESDPQMLNVKVRKMSRASGMSILLPATKGAAPIFRSGAQQPPADSVPAPSVGLPEQPPRVVTPPRPRDTTLKAKPKVKQ
jgi:LPS export ABC transporter protein LptC